MISQDTNPVKLFGSYRRITRLKMQDYGIWEGFLLVRLKRGSQDSLSLCLFFLLGNVWMSHRPSLKFFKDPSAKRDAAWQEPELHCFPFKVWRYIKLHCLEYSITCTNIIYHTCYICVMMQNMRNYSLPMPRMSYYRSQGPCRKVFV